jgi:rhodanese-related sulfurtransferase
LTVPVVVDRDELRRLVEEDHAQVIEVLPRDEYDDEHLPDAVHLPLKQLDAAAAARTLDAGRPVVVYCWDGL